MHGTDGTQTLASTTGIDVAGVVPIRQILIVIVGHQTGVPANALGVHHVGANEAVAMNSVGGTLVIDQVAGSAASHDGCGAYDASSRGGDVHLGKGRGRNFVDHSLVRGVLGGQFAALMFQETSHPGNTLSHLGLRHTGILRGGLGLRGCRTCVFGLVGLGVLLGHAVVKDNWERATL